MDASRDDQIGDESKKFSTDSAQKFSQEVICLKVLVPSIAAGAIIGKGGEAIAQVQNETGAKIKLSKLNDFYPGTSERVCLIQGTIDGVRAMHNYIIDRILEKPEVVFSPHNTQPIESGTRCVTEDSVTPIGQHSGAILIPRIFPSGWISPLTISPFVGQSSMNRILWERHKQVKILVPNCTAGLVIGKLGTYVNEIKDRTGAFIQISQKPKEINLIERCITIAGEPGQLRAAVDLVLAKIAEDPQSGTCPHISYSHIEGPVASAFPTGSPFAIGPPNIPSIGSNASRSFVADEAAATGFHQRSNVANNNQIILQAAASGYQQQQQQYDWESLKSISCVAPAVLPIALPRPGMDPSSAAILQTYASPTSPGDPHSLKGLIYRTNSQPTDISPGYAYPISPCTRPQSYISLSSAAANPFLLQSALSSPTADAFRDPSVLYDPNGHRFAYFPTNVSYTGSIGDVNRVCGLYTGIEENDSFSKSLGSMPYPGQAPSLQSYPQSFYATAIPQLFPRTETPINPSLLQSPERNNQSLQGNISAGSKTGAEMEPCGGVSSNSTIQTSQQPRQESLSAMQTYLPDQLQMGERVENLHNSLRISGYPEEVISEITCALSTLSLHGILNIGSPASRSQFLPVATSTKLISSSASLLPTSEA